MSNSVVAYRYAKALFDLAKEKNAIEKVKTDMGFFETICNENDNFRAVMASPIVRHDKKLAVLRSIFEKNVDKISFSIFNLLTSKNREVLILPIAKEFQALYNEEFGFQNITVSSAVKLSEDQIAALTKQTEAKTKRKVILQEKIDESLIGGFVIRIGDTQIDTSVKKKLNDLKLTLA